MKIQILLITGILSLSVNAHADRLFTPTLWAVQPDALACNLTNVSRRTRTVRVRIITNGEVLLKSERFRLAPRHTADLDPKSADQVIQLTEDIVSREKLTTLMVTHSMHQAANLGDRLIMVHRGQIIYDCSGAEKRRLRVDDLLARFDEVRRGDRLDESAAALLRKAYV
jgi:ABC-type uncharacterized transport system ATPase subunit